MLGLSGTSSYAVFVYLCICICVFVHETLGNISFDILGPIAFQKCMVCCKFTYRICYISFLFKPVLEVTYIFIKVTLSVLSFTA